MEQFTVKEIDGWMDAECDKRMKKNKVVLYPACHDVFDSYACSPTCHQASAVGRATVYIGYKENPASAGVFLPV